MLDAHKHGNSMETLSAILRNQKSYNYFMVHMQREFCEETLLCIKAIELFKRAPDLNKVPLPGLSGTRCLPAPDLCAVVCAAAH